jgi:predicted GIY-YIG superfamily endonuclease
MMKLKATLSETITQKQVYKPSFSELVAGFEKKLAEFNPTRNCFDIEPYFGDKSGLKSATKSLIADNRISKDWLPPDTIKEGNEKNDFQGLYVFIHNDTPIYTGISKGVIGRILQHVKGANHYSATLAYIIGRTMSKHTGKREELNFANNVKPYQKFLLQQKIAFLPIQNIEEMYLFEIYCAMQLQCSLNTFETH